MDLRRLAAVTISIVVITLVVVHGGPLTALLLAVAALILAAP